MKNKNRRKRIEHFNEITGGVTAVNSAFLLALSTKFINLPIDDFIQSPIVWAAFFSAVSLPFLFGFIFVEPYEEELGLTEKNHISFVGSFGLTMGFLAYVCIVYAINSYVFCFFLGSMAIVSLIFLHAAYSHASRSPNTIDADHFSVKMVLSDRLE